MATFSYFKWSFIVTIAGLALGGWLGWNATGTLSGMLTIFFICAVLAVLEISLSFDNAIVSANKLKWPAPTEWPRMNVSAAVVVVPWGAWPAERVGLAQPAGRPGLG